MVYSEENITKLRIKEFIDYLDLKVRKFIDSCDKIGGEMSGYSLLRKQLLILMNLKKLLIKILSHCSSIHIKTYFKLLIKSFQILGKEWL